MTETKERALRSKTAAFHVVSLLELINQIAFFLIYSNFIWGHSEFQRKTPLLSDLLYIFQLKKTGEHTSMINMSAHAFGTRKTYK